MIVEVNEETLYSAAVIHSKAWKESHKSFCSEQFVNKHTVEAQKIFLHNEMKDGKRLYMLIYGKPVGIVSIKNDFIENLYVLPNEERKGYGTELLHFAINACINNPRLTVLDNNVKAIRLYTKFGFAPTGNIRKLTDEISEIEMEKYNNFK